MLKAVLFKFLTVAVPRMALVFSARAFSISARSVWNTLPFISDNTRLETFLFTESYPDIRLI